MFNLALISAAGICAETVIKEHQVSITQVRSKDTNKKKTGSIILETSNGEQVYRKVVMLGENFDFTYFRPSEWNIKV